MIGIQLDVITQGIYFIRPETLEQLLPSLNQYFSYAEMLVNNRRNQPPGRGPVAQGNAIQQQRVNMTANSPMLHPNVINQQNQQFNRAGIASPLMQQNPASNSPIIRPNMLLNSPQIRPMALPQQMQNQPQFIQQQINIAQSKFIHINQQLQQLRQMSMGPIPPEQMMNLQMRQQELLKSQQNLTQQLNSYSQIQHQAMLQVQRGQAARPPGVVDPNYLAQMQMMQQNSRMANPQTMEHRSPHMQGNQTFQHQTSQQLQQMQQMQQQQLQQMQQMRNQSQAVTTPALSDLQSSPKMGPGSIKQPSATSPKNPSSVIKTEPNSPKEVTPRMQANQPTPQPTTASPGTTSPVQQAGELSQTTQYMNQQRQGQQGMPIGMPMGQGLQIVQGMPMGMQNQQGQLQNSQEMQQAQAMMLQGIGIRPPAPGQMNITPEQMQQLMQMANHHQQMGMPGHMIRHRMNGSMQAHHIQNMNIQNMRQQQQFSSTNPGQFVQQKANSQPGTPDFQLQQHQYQLHQQQQQLQQQQHLADQRLRTGLSATGIIFCLIVAEQVDDPFNIGAEPLSAEGLEDEKDESKFYILL
jgi:hypothetical protein